MNRMTMENEDDCFQKAICIMRMYDERQAHSIAINNIDYTKKSEFIAVLGIDSIHQCWSVVKNPISIWLRFS